MTRRPSGEATGAGQGEAGQSDVGYQRQPGRWSTEARRETQPETRQEPRAQTWAPERQPATRQLPTWPAADPGPPSREGPPSLDDLTEPERPRRRGGPWVWGGAAVVLVVVVGIVLWQVLGTGDSNQSQPGGAPPPASSTTQPPRTSEQPQPAVVPPSLLTTLPALPGTPLKANPMQPVDTIVKDGYYNGDIAAGIGRAGAKSILLRESVQSGSRIYLLAVIPASTPRLCQTTAAVINNFQRAIGLTDDQGAAFGPNTVTLSRKDKAGTYFRSAYCSGRMTVIVGSAVADPKQANRLQTGFTDIGRATVRVLPPN